MALLSVMIAKADEGMWLPYSLNGQNLAEMQALGCKLTAEQIFSFNQPSIKYAIVQFGGGCTGELISGSGLLVTNHHCGYGRYAFLPHARPRDAEGCPCDAAHSVGEGAEPRARGGGSA